MNRELNQPDVPNPDVQSPREPAGSSTQSMGNTSWVARNGFAGYGFKLRGSKGRRSKVPDPKEQQVMRWIVEQRQADRTWEWIYLDLSRRKERTRAGREWSVSRIRRAYLAEIQGKTREPVPPRPKKPHRKLLTA